MPRRSGRALLALLLLSAAARAGAGAGKRPAWPPPERDTPAGAGMRGSLKDAGRIAFATNRDGNWEIYSMNADGSDVRNLTNHPGRDEYPRWSADGKRLVFWSDRDGPAMPGAGGVPPALQGRGTLYVMDADGSHQKRVTEGTHGAFSPDGKVLAFRRGHRIWLRGLENGREVPVTSRLWRSATMPVFSPDAKYLAFIINTRHWDVLAMPVDAEAGYVAHPGRHWIVSARKGCNPEFLPDGIPDGKPDGAGRSATGAGRSAGRLIHVVDLGGDTHSNFVIAPFVPNKKQSPAELDLGWDRPSWNYFPDPSPDGAFLAYSHGPGYNEPGGGERGWEMTRNMELVVRRFSDGETIWLTKTGAGRAAGAVNRDPDWFDPRFAPKEKEAE